ncbi:MAG: DUF6375 family protein [Candidatus Omnitrophota bacterium]
MKIWREFGTEHSWNLVMIGTFKNSDDAKKTKELIEQLTEKLHDKVNVGKSSDRYPEEVSNVLREADCFILSPFELEHFLYDISTHVEGDKIILKTDESEISAFFKLMVHNGARVEIYSAHDYPDEKYGRGK